VTEINKVALQYKN